MTQPDQSAPTRSNLINPINLLNLINLGLLFSVWRR